MGDELRQSLSRPNPQTPLYVGIALILLGFFYLLDSLNVPWLWWFAFDVLWPILLILGGVALIVRRNRGQK
jgi:hypothetical protein